MKELLLVDDNDKYAKILTDYFSPLGYRMERACSAAEGLQKMQEKGIDFFSVIVTDITMETQLAGVFMLGKIKKMGYKGTVVVASTGFDVPPGMTVSRLILPFFGVHYVVPKTTVLKKELLFYPVNFSKPLNEFREI